MAGMPRARTTLRVREAAGLQTLVFFDRGHGAWYVACGMWYES